METIIFYRTADEKISVSVRFEDVTAWLTQAQLVKLFGSSKANISEHIKHIFEENELQQDSVVRKFRTTAVDGKNYDTEHYNLDLIISLGYRIKSSIATQFRQCATVRLKEYIVKGFTMDDERLKNLGGGYWRELLVRIRDIRASEKVFYRQILDIYATSVDYDANDHISIDFFKKVQNKIHYAVHGQTAAEVIYNRADAEKEFIVYSCTRSQQVDKNWYMGEHDIHSMNEKNYRRKIELVHHKESSKDALKVMKEWERINRKK